jgi:hypothetical protein
MYPTAPGGREWFLPSHAEISTSEWAPEIDLQRVASGVYHTGGQVRMSVRSPDRRAWWRNVEMTGYIRYTGPAAGEPDQPPHIAFYARGERHSELPLDAALINDGIVAPAGTVTWPGYPFSGSINPHCLGTAYHGSVFMDDGRVAWDKELSHTQGYTDTRRGVSQLSGFAPRGRWFGFKVVIRNVVADGSVELEIWVDAGADGTWVQVSEAVDQGDWRAGTTAIDGCGAAPFGYRANQVVDWAGPWATFRADSMEFDFAKLSVREIDPLTRLESPGDPLPGGAGQE